MKPTQTVALATWMLEHLTFGSHDEALSGDLLEELRDGRSEGWYWGQVLSAIGVAVAGRLRTYAWPIAFSFGWSILYPAWCLVAVRNRPVQVMIEEWSTHDWPYSTALQGVIGALPTIAFVWLGFFVYLTASGQTVRQLSGLRLLGSLSISLNVLFLATIARLNHFGGSGAGVGQATPQSFDSLFGALSIPLGSSLLSAIVFAIGFARRRHRSGPLAG